MDIERTIEFILQHEAQFAAEMGQLKERQKEFAAGLEQLKERQEEFAAGLGQLKAFHVDLRNSVEALTVVVRTQQEEISRILRITEVLAESQCRTDERLNTLIRIVDDLVRRDSERR